MPFLEGEGGRFREKQNENESEKNKLRQQEDPGYKKQFNPNKCVNIRIWKLNASFH